MQANYEVPRLTPEKVDAVARGELCGHCLGTLWIRTPNGGWTGCRNCAPGREGPSRLPSLPPLRSRHREKGDELEGVKVASCGRCRDGLIEIPGGGWTNCDCEAGQKRLDERENE